MHSRRTILRLMAASVPLIAVGCGGDAPEPVFDAESVPESVSRFPRTPITGDMTDTTAVLAFFVADDAAVTLRVWSGDGVVVDRAVTPSGDGFHKVRLDALTPGTAYAYAVFSGEAPLFSERSLIARFQTAPEASSQPVVRVGLLCCVGSGSILPDYYLPEASGTPTEEPFFWELFQNTADQEVDFFVHLGDQAYLDFVWSMDDGAVDSYLEGWGFYHGGGYRDVYPRAGVYMTWDDHESVDNSQFEPDAISETDARRLRNAQEAWFKVNPVATDALPIWRSFRWGGTVELIVLDCRYELSDTGLVSAEQLAFLLETIEQSPCRFVCVATPRPFAEIVTPEFYEDNRDRWDAFPDDRNAVRDLLDTLEARHVVFVTGDIHVNYLGTLTESGTSVADTRWEVCCTSGNMSPLVGSLKEPQYPFADAKPHLPVLTFDPEAGEVHVAFYAADGTLSFDQVLTDL